MSDLEQGVRLSEVLAIARRRAAVIGVFAAVGAVLGVALFALNPSSYEATARVRVQDVGFGTAAPTGSVAPDLPTEQDLVRSDAVGDAVRRKLRLSGDNRALFAKVTVSNKNNSQVLDITFVDTSARRAKDGANAVADAYLAVRIDDAATTRRRKLAALRPQIDAATKTLAEANKTIATVTGSSARTQAQTTAQQAVQTLNSLNAERAAIAAVDVTAVGSLVQAAPSPDPQLNVKGLALGVGVFGLFTLAGIVVALIIDRNDTRGGGRRRVEQLVPSAGIRMLPATTGRRADPSAYDAAVDRLAIELIARPDPDRAASVLLVGTHGDPPLALAEQIASSLNFAGIPALFVLAGATARQMPQAHVVTSFTDLITGPTVSGPPTLPEVSGLGAPNAQHVTWLRPKASTEASGLLRRAVVEALVTRAGREHYEAVVFITSSPARGAAATALGQWVATSAVIVDDPDRATLEHTVTALRDGGVTISEVVWT